MQAETLWTTLVSAEPAFGKRFASDSFGATTQLLKLMARLAPQYKRIEGRDASGDGKGQGKGSPQPNASRASKGTGKGGGKANATPFAELKIPACFKDLVGGEPPFIDASELQDGVCGIEQVAFSEANRLTLAYLDAKPFDLPCALLTSTSAAKELFEKRQDLVERYAITKIKVPVLRGNAAGDRTVDALLIQLGSHSCPVRFS